MYLCIIVMCSTSDNVSANIKMAPEYPLELIRFTKITKTGDIRSSLKLCNNTQEMVFKNALHLIGNSLTLVIPKYVSDTKGKLYEVPLPSGTNIMIQDISGNLLPLCIIEVECENAYYVLMQIDEGMYSESDLVLFVTKLDLCITRISPCGCESHCKCREPGEWKWISTMLME